VHVFDTSAYINGQRLHFFPSMLPSVWDLVAEAIDDQRIILPRAVYRELLVYDDDLAAWIKKRSAAVVEPSEEVQQLAGTYQEEFPTRPRGTRPTHSSWRRRRPAASPS
jgi:hypothetical protein